jgi:hypothetical protein
LEWYDFGALRITRANFGVSAFSGTCTAHHDLGVPIA